MAPSAGGWQQTVIYSFGGADGFYGSRPVSGLSARGNRYYGATPGGPAFKLTRTTAGWTYATLFSFDGREGGPTGNYGANMLVGAAGRLYCATAGDGTNNFGAVYEVTP